jgi:signal transduction histidine kinase
VSLDEVRESVGANHHLTFVADDTIQVVYIDETLISRILLNLLSNAIKFSPEQSEICLELSRSGKWIVIRVRDEGIGISETALPLIFEPFYRAEEVQKIGGTGLGLNIVKECVERHNGRIHVASQIGKGAVFTVELPLIEAY